MKYLILTIALCFSQIGLSQEVTEKDLHQLIAKWERTLTYLNYGDDKTQVELKTEMDALWSKDDVLFKFRYEEPNGKVVEGKDQISLESKNGKTIINKDWTVSEFQKISNGWRLLIVTDGKDNGNKSSIQKEIVLADSTLQIKKLVKYNGTDNYFQRHIYQLTKR